MDMCVMCVVMSVHGHADTRSEGTRESECQRGGFKCSVHVSSVSMTMYDDSKWKDTYNMISRPRL